MLNAFDICIKVHKVSTKLEYCHRLAANFHLNAYVILYSNAHHTLHLEELWSPWTVGHQNLGETQCWGLFNQNYSGISTLESSTAHRQLNNQIYMMNYSDHIYTCSLPRLSTKTLMIFGLFSLWREQTCNRTDCLPFHVKSLIKWYSAFRKWCLVFSDRQTFTGNLRPGRFPFHFLWLPDFQWPDFFPLIFLFLADLISYWPVISCLPYFSSFLASTPLCSWTYYRAISPRRWRVHPKGAITVNKHYCRLSDNMLPRW